MPPAQCPTCGRFLKNSFVASLAEAPAPCPACGTELRHEQFGAHTAATASPASPASPTERAEDELHGGGPDRDASTQAGTTATETAPPSVRPPDLAPDAVRGAADDPLRGWDTGDPTVDAWRQDRPPFPTDTVVVAGAGLAGALLGVALGGDRRGVAAAGGAVAGVVAAAVARRVWQLET